MSGQIGSEWNQENVLIYVKGLGHAVLGNLFNFVSYEL